MMSLTHLKNHDTKHILFQILKVKKLNMKWIFLKSIYLIVLSLLMSTVSCNERRLKRPSYYIWEGHMFYNEFFLKTWYF